MENWCNTQGVQTGALWQPRGVEWDGSWEGSSIGRGHMHTYDWFMMIFDRNQPIL